MGRNKALLELDGRPLIRTVLEQAVPLTEEIFVSSNDNDLYGFLGLPVIPDVFAGQGPLAGVHAAMRHTSRELLLVLACDLPGIHRRLLESLVANAAGNDAVVPRTDDGRIHPTCAVYRRSCLPILEASLPTGMNKVARFLESPGLRVKWLAGSEGRFCDADLRNLNTAEDLHTERARFRHP